MLPLICPARLRCRSGASLVLAALTLAGSGLRAQSYTFTTLAGGPGAIGTADGTGAAARFNFPRGVAVDRNGIVYVADTLNHTIRRIGPGGVVTTIAGLAGSSGAADGTGSTAKFREPRGIAVDAVGNLYISDSGNHTIRMITVAGNVSTLAGSAGSPGSANGTGNAARFNNPRGVAVDAAGNLYVADTDNHTIRRIAPGGVVTTVAGTPGLTGPANGSGAAARFTNPDGIAVDSAGNIYVGDLGNDLIRMITGGTVTIIAGSPGPGSADGTGPFARFDGPRGVAVDAIGNIFIADNGNSTVRRILPGLVPGTGGLVGIVTTIGGLAGVQGSADGTGSAARFFALSGVAVDSAGNLYIADTYNHTIRRAATAAPAPTIASTAPASVVAGSGAFTLTVTGTGFVSGTTVQWNGANRTTTFVSGTQVTVAISAADVATAGTAQVTVVNPAPGGGTSAARSFSITAGPVGPPTVGFILPGSRSTHPSNQNISISLSVGGDQTGVVDYVVTTGGNTLTLRPPTLAGQITAADVEAWDSVSVRARNAAGVVVASAMVDIFLARPFVQANVGAPRGRHSCSIATLLRILLGLPPVDRSAPPPTFPPRQALLRAAADLLDIDLDVYRAFRDNVLSTTPAGRYYTDVHDRTSFALIEIAVREPTQGLAMHQTLVDWTPAIRALLNQQGGTVTITPAMAAQAQTMLTNLRRSATGELAAIMDAEIAALNPSTWSGLTIGQLLARVESQPRTPPPVAAPGRISNMSIRSAAGTGAQTLIVGAVIGGESTLSTKPLLIRGVGPALTAFGVPGALADPALTVFAGTNAVASNDNWNGDAQVIAIGNAVGAFGLAPATSRDAALYAPTLAPRDYTIQITGAGGGTGVALAELYDATPADSFTSTRPQLVNVSARTQVGTGADILIAGFTLAGDRPRRLMIRAVGPTLGAFGVTGALVDPQLALFSGTNRLQENNDWGAAANAAEVTAATTQLGTFQLGAGARDSAILTTLQPGSYTAQISGVSNTTGVALVEIYVLP